MKYSIRLAVLFVLLSLPTWAATNYYVRTDGSDAHTGLSNTAAAAWLTIQKCANTMVAGDTCNVNDGIYPAPVTIVTSGTATNPITFQSINKWGAIIAPNGSYNADSTIVTWSGSSQSYINFKNFDVKDGAVTSGLKYGIRALGSHINILGNKVHHINAGSGAVCQRGAAIGTGVDTNIVDSNVIFDVGPPRPGATCFYMHGVYIQGNNSVASNNLIYDCYECTALTANSGSTAQSNTKIVNNLAFHNGSSNVGGSGVLSGGSIAVSCDIGGCSTILIANNIFMDNTSVGGGSMQCWNGGWTNVTATNNIRYNAGPDCINSTGWPGWAVDSTVSPQLVNYQANGSGDYHLQSTSPAINTGTSSGAPLTDYDGVTRPQGAGFDIGIYEFVATAGCFTSATGFVNNSIASQTTSFRFEADVTPNASSIDALTFLSANAVGTFTDMAVTVRFNTTGTIDARNGGSYAANATIPYVSGSVYHVRMDISIPLHIYSVFITPPGQAEQTLATNYAFRTEQAGVTSLGFWGLQSNTGTHKVCNVVLTALQPCIAKLTIADVALGD